jgi:hypothetical protein
MKPDLKCLVLAGGLAIGGLAMAAAPARAQVLSFGYSGPGVSVGVATGGNVYYGGGYYGGGYYRGYPVAPAAPLVVSPVAPVIVRPPLVVPGPWIGPRAYVVRRPYGWYGPYPRYYRRW